MIRTIWCTINYHGSAPNNANISSFDWIDYVWHTKVGIIKIFKILARNLTITKKMLHHRNKVNFNKHACNLACILEIATKMYKFTTLCVTTTNNVHQELDIYQLSRYEERKNINLHWHHRPPGWYKLNTNASRWDSTRSTTVSYVH